jgi:hypothetical protein
LAQPLADLGLIGDLAHAKEFARRRILVARLTVGKTAAARARGMDQLPDNDLQPVATLFVRPGL